MTTTLFCDWCTVCFVYFVGFNFCDRIGTIYTSNMFIARIKWNNNIDNVA